MFSQSWDNTVFEQTLTRNDFNRLALAGPGHLIECRFDEEELADLDLSRWRFERCSLGRASFGGATLEETVWQSCRGAFANFGGARLDEATVWSSDFNNSNFKGARLNAAKFIGCKLTGADLSEIRGTDLSFEESLLINAKLPGYSFRKMLLKRIDFSQADLRKCDFRAVIFEECSLRETNLLGSRFDGADLRGADLGGLKLVDAGLFRGATISRAQAGELLSELGINVL